MSRSTRPAEDHATDADLLAIAGPVRRSVRARLAADGGSPRVTDVEDVVQETLTRVWEVRWRLERETLLSYASVVARNLVTSQQRKDALRDRYGPRLLPAPADADPEAALLAAEEHAAVARALLAMRAEDRTLLVEHEVHGVGVRELAGDEGVAPTTVAARLARARARLRVEHLLSLRGVTLPTPRCRGVLEAISLGDRGRQRRLSAAEHLLLCPTCADLAEPLLTRRRSLTAAAPVALLLAAPGRLWAWARAHPLPASGAGAAATAVVVTVAVLGTRDQPAPETRAPAAAPAVPATLSIGGARVLPAAAVGPMTAQVGRRAVARDVPVESVPADEGFWVGAGPGRRVWVQLRTSSESAITVRRGDRLSFTGTVERAAAGMPARVGLTAPEGADELRAEGGYVLVVPRDITVR